MKYFAIQGIWDLGCKDARFCCYCPFDKRFETYLTKIIIFDEVNDHAKGLCKCNNRKKGYSYGELTQHMNSSLNWLHRMLGFYMHCLYDDYDEYNMKFIVLDPVVQAKNRKRVMSDFQVSK